MKSPSPIRRAAFVAHDAGGARALFPVAEELHRRGVETETIIAGPAVKIWRDEAPHLPVFAVEDDVSVESLSHHLAASGAEVLLSASGLYNRVEHTARLAARRVGLPITALLDSWLNYAQRFEREENGMVSAARPDRLCVIDDWTREGAIAVGFDPASVFVTGHPDLEKTVRTCRVHSASENQALRREAGVNESGLLIVFFSDPFYIGPNMEYYSGSGALMYPDGRPIFGYTVREILPEVLRELEAAMHADNTSCDFIVRPHPWEHDAALRQILAETRLERVRARLHHGLSAIDWIHCADALIGMMTIALLHAALAEKPAVSVQIGQRESGEEDPCVSNSLGYTRGIYDRDELRSVCRAIARREWPALQLKPRYPLLLEGAAARVADVLLRCADPVAPAPIC